VFSTAYNSPNGCKLLQSGVGGTDDATNMQREVGEKLSGVTVILDRRSFFFERQLRDFLA
jgi:hypothetical protein